MPNHCPQRLTTDDLVALLREREPDVLRGRPPTPPPRAPRTTIFVAAAIAIFAVGLATTWGTLAAAGRLSPPPETENIDRINAELSTVRRDVDLCRQENSKLEQEMRIAAEQHANEISGLLEEWVMTGERAEADAAAWIESGDYAEAVQTLQSFERFLLEGQFEDGIASVFESAILAALPELEEEERSEVERISELIEQLARTTTSAE